MSTLCDVRKDDDFVLVKPVRNSPRDSQYYIYPQLGYVELLDIKRKFAYADCIAIDFETRGNDPTQEMFTAVGVGLSSADYTVYVPNTDVTVFTELLTFLARNCGRVFIAHNAYFDGHVWMRYVDKDVLRTSFQACTFALYTQIANEGFIGQHWGLKDAMIDMLGWAAPNTAELDAWLVHNGHVNGAGSPDHGEMWRAPAGILGRYCCADADATYQLFNDVLVPACAPFEELVKFHQDWWLPFTSMLIHSREGGIRLDVPLLQKYERELTDKILKLEQAWFTHPDVIDLVQRWREKEVSDLPPPKKPTKKDGTPSTSYIKWKEKCESVLNGTHPKHQFNLDSQAQLRWLYYRNLYKDHVEKVSDARFENDREFPAMYRVFGIDIPATDGGAIPMNKNTMPLLGDTGKLLAQREKLVKELEYVHSYLTLQRDGRLYPSFKVPGTVTGRLGGKEPNIQQLPKHAEVLQCFLPDDGNVIIEADFTALEQVVLAEFSRDPALLQLYGVGSSPHNDVYLFNAAHMDPFKDEVRKHYSVDAPTKESTKKAKESCAKIRKIVKGVTLARSYGAGAEKVYQNLRMQGIDITPDTVSDIIDGMNTLYAGQREYRLWVEQQWRNNGGWVLNGHGRPMCVPEKLRKDCVNRVIQSSGHDALVFYLNLLESELNSAGIDWSWFIVDFHDETMVECKEKDSAVAMDCFRRANIKLNELLGGNIPLKIEPKMARNLAEAKLE